MKNIFYLIISLLLTVVVVGGVIKMTSSDTSDTTTESTAMESTDDFWQDSASDSVDIGNSSEDNEEEELPTLKGLKIPANEADYIEERMEMRTGAQLFVGSNVERPQLRFSCNVTKELKEEIENSENKELAMLIFPVKGFDYVNPNGYTYIDWIPALDRAGQSSYVLSMFDGNYNADGDNFYIAQRFQNIPYSQMNNSLAALGVVITTHEDGTRSYLYSKLPADQTYQSNARSVAYVAAASLNANKLGMENFNAEQLKNVKGYINESVDKANGLVEPTNDGSMYEFTVMPTGPKAMKIGEMFTLSVEIMPNINVPIWYRSTDENIVAVDDNGNVTAVSTGTAVIGVYVAGEVVGVTITVS